MEKWFKRFDGLHPMRQAAIFTLFSLLIAAYGVGLVFVFRRFSGWML